MTTRAIHILTEEGDPVPATGDPIAVLTGDPAIFIPGYPSRPLTAAEVKVLRAVHAMTEPSTETGE